MAVISPELNTNAFKSASGKEYIVYPSLTARRFEVFERLQVEMEHATTLSAFRGEVAGAYELLNKSKFADAAVKINNLLNGAARIENGQPHPLLLICSLFICPAEENQAEWSEAEATEKIKDWAGVDIAFFLASAKRLLSRFITDYATDSLNISEVEKIDAAMAESGQPSTE